MGVGWRRFRERLHQGSPLGGGDFQPTSNARCAAMLDEARSFLAQLRRCEGAIRRMAAANAEGLNTVQAVMSAPLPRPHEETAGGGAAAAHGAGLIGGEGFSAEAMGSAAADVSHKSEAEVLAPLQRWSGVYSQLGVGRTAEIAESCTQGRARAVWHPSSSDACTWRCLEICEQERAAFIPRTQPTHHPGTRWRRRRALLSWRACAWR